MTAYAGFLRRLQRELIKLKGVEALEAQYLEYTVQEGWKPLLDFLLDAEDDQQELISSLSIEPFPHVNDRSTLIMISNVLDFIGMVFPIFIIFLLCTLFILARVSVQFLLKASEIVSSTTINATKKHL